MICQCLPYQRKKFIVNSVNSEVTGLNLTKILYNGEEFMPVISLKSDLQYSIRVGMAVRQRKLVAMVTSLVRSQSDILS